MVQAARRGGAVCLATLSIAAIFAALTARAFTSADADTLFEAHTKAFYRMTNGGSHYLKSAEENKPADFWTEAEQLEMVLDTYQRTSNAQQLVMFTNLFHGFLAEHGATWEHNPYNDDIMWMVIACTRAHLLTGNPEFLAVARTNFDLCYARAASDEPGGGGLWWRGGSPVQECLCERLPGAIAGLF